MRTRSCLVLLGVLLSPISLAAQSIEQPKRGETHYAGGPLTVRWTKFGNVPNMVSISLRCRSVAEQVLSAQTPNDGLETVSLPEFSDSLLCRIVVSALPDRNIAGASGEFRIVPRPAGGEKGPPPGAEPDLIGCLYWDGKRPHTGEQKTVTAVVRNVGIGRSAHTSFDLYVEGDAMASNTPSSPYFGLHNFGLPALNPGKDFARRMRLSWRHSGHKTVRLTVDPANQVAEKNEANNRIEAQVSVIWPGQDRYVGETKVCSDQK